MGSMKDVMFGRLNTVVGYKVLTSHLMSPLAMGTYETCYRADQRIQRPSFFFLSLHQAITWRNTLQDTVDLFKRWNERNRLEIWSMIIDNPLIAPKSVPSHDRIDDYDALWRLWFGSTTEWDDQSLEKCSCFKDVPFVPVPPSTVLSFSFSLGNKKILT